MCAGLGWGFLVGVAVTRECDIQPNQYWDPVFRTVVYVVMVGNDLLINPGPSCVKGVELGIM